MTHFTLNYSQFVHLKLKKLSLKRNNLLSIAEYVTVLPKKYNETKQAHSPQKSKLRLLHDIQNEHSTAIDNLKI